MSSAVSLSSVGVVQLRRVRAAGGRHGIVFAQVERHLAIMVGVMPDNHRGDAQPGIWPGVRAFDGIEHVLRVHGTQGFAHSGKRVKRPRTSLARISHEFWIEAVEWS